MPDKDFVIVGDAMVMLIEAADTPLDGLSSFNRFLQIVHAELDGIRALVDDALFARQMLVGGLEMDDGLSVAEFAEDSAGVGASQFLYGLAGFKYYFCHCCRFLGVG